MTMQSPGRHWRLPSSAAAGARMLGASILLGSVRQLGRGQRDLHTFISIVNNVPCNQSEPMFSLYYPNMLTH